MSAKVPQLAFFPGAPPTKVMKASHIKAPFLPIVDLYSCQCSSLSQCPVRYPDTCDKEPGMHCKIIRLYTFTLPEIGFLQLMIWVPGPRYRCKYQASFKIEIVVSRLLLIGKDFEQGIIAWLMAQSTTICTDTLLVLAIYAGWLSRTIRLPLNFISARPHRLQRIRCNT